MLPPEPAVIAARQGIVDAQVLLTGSAAPIGTFTVSWYGTSVSDERGSFAVVNPGGPLALAVGDFLRVVYGGNSVYVYVIGSYLSLTSDLGLARRPYMELSLLAVEPILAIVETVQ